MGRQQVKFSRANLLGMGKVVNFVDDEIQGVLPLSLKRRYKTILFPCKSLFFLPCYSVQVGIYSLLFADWQNPNVKSDGQELDHRVARVEKSVSLIFLSINIF